MGWKNYGDVWMNDETGALSDTDPTPAAAPSPTTDAVQTSAPGAAPAAAPGLPGKKQGITWLPRTAPAPEDPVQRAWMQQESSGGRDKAHEVLRDGSVAGGSYGMTPDFVRDAVRTDPELHAKYASLLTASDDAVSNAINKDDALDDALFQSSFPKILSKPTVGGKLDRARVEWYAGAKGLERYDRDAADPEAAKADAKWFGDISLDLDRFHTNLQKSHLEASSGDATDAASLNARPPNAPAGYIPSRGGGSPALAEHAANGPAAVEMAPPGPMPSPLPAPPPAGMPGTGVGAVAIDRGPAAAETGPGQSLVNAEGTPVAYRSDTGEVANAPGPKTGRQSVKPDDLSMAPEGSGTSPTSTPMNPLEQQFMDTETEIQRQIRELPGWSADREAKLNQQSKDIQDAKINPERLWASKSTPQKILIALSLGLGSFGAAMNHGPNYAQQMLQQAIQDDVEAQKAELGKRTTLYSENLKQYGDERQARLATIMGLNQAARSIAAEVRATRGQSTLKPALQQQVASIDAGLDAIRSRREQLKGAYSGAWGNFVARIPIGTKTRVARESKAATDLAIADAMKANKWSPALVDKIAAATPNVDNTPTMQGALLDAIEQRLLAKRNAIMSEAGVPSTPAPSSDVAGEKDVQDEDGEE